MLGQSNHFLGINQCSKELMCLADGHNRASCVGSNPVPLASESDALHRAPITQLYLSYPVYKLLKDC